MRERVLIFANPIAGRGSGRKLAQRLAGRFERAGIEPILLFDRPDQIDDHSIGAVKDSRAAVVIGGDGTLRAVAQRLVGRGATKATPPISSAPPLLVVPMGTANLMGHHLGIRWNRANPEDQLLAAIQNGKTRALDAARINGELFFLMAGVGLDAMVVHELARHRKGPITLMTYLEPVLRTLGGYDFPSIEVRVDGATVFGARPGIAFIGNTREYGTGFAMLPEARSDDGLLDVCCLPMASAPDAVFAALRAVAGEHARAEGAVYVKGRTVRVDSARPVPVQVDGDAAGATPIDIALLDERVRFIVP